MAQDTPESADRALTRPLARRRLLGGAVGAAAGLTLIGHAPAETAAAAPPAQGDAPSVPGSTNIVHSTNPPLEETRVEQLTGLLVPTENFFVRNHAATPQIDAATWRLSVGGQVERPFEITYNELRTLADQRSVMMFLECAGNGRGRFDPPADGTKWTMGAAGTAEWTGVPLMALLERAGVRPGAVDLVCTGGDTAQVERGLPMAVAMEPNTMVVWSMNGAPLLPAHGFPVRLLVPGWIGVASVKWLIKLEVIDRPFDGVFNNVRYMLQDRSSGHPDAPATVQPVKSYINQPAPGSTVQRGQRLITGYAWSGYGPIARVEISADGGQTWRDARILEPRLPLAWVRFDLPWDAQAVGTVKLASRATDELGNVQAETVEWNRQGYSMNAIYSFDVTVV